MKLIEYLAIGNLIVMSINILTYDISDILTDAAARSYLIVDRKNVRNSPSKTCVNNNLKKRMVR